MGVGWLPTSKGVGIKEGPVGYGVSECVSGCVGVCDRMAVREYV